MTERPVVDFDLRRIGIHMPKVRYQRGSLRTSVPPAKGKPARKLPRGTFWAQWYQYVRTAEGTERRRRREKIIDRALAQKYRIPLDCEGPLNKSDAQRVLDLLIAQDTGTYIPPDTAATVAMVAQEYLALSQPNWGPHMVRSAGSLIKKHIVNGTLGQRAIADVDEAELQGWLNWLNEYVSSGSSKSLLKGLLLHTRAVWKHARKRKIMTENPTEDLRAKSRKRPSERTLTMDECQRLLSAVTGRDHLIFGIFVQLGLRPEETFALRRDDVERDRLRIDEALVEGEPAPTKTEASDDYVYVPPSLQVELRTWLERTDGEPNDWLFQPTHGRRGHMNQNNYRERVLQPAAIRAGVGVYSAKGKDGKPVQKTDVDFRVLRRTCATLFGGYAKDPKSTQAQLRHADPTITLKHYQKSIPESVRAAAIAFEQALKSSRNRTGIEQVGASSKGLVN